MEFLGKEPQLKLLENFSDLALKFLFSEALKHVLNETCICSEKLFRFLNSDVPFATFKEALNGIVFLVAWLQENNPENSGRYTLANILTTHTALGEETIGALEETIAPKLASGKPKMLKSRPKLLEAQTSLGVVEDFNCSKLSLPKVNLSLRLSDFIKAKETTETLQLDPKQLRELVSELKKAREIMDTL